MYVYMVWSNDYVYMASYIISLWLYVVDHLRKFSISQIMGKLV